MGKRIQLETVYRPMPKAASSKPVKAAESDAEKTLARIRENRAKAMKRYRANVRAKKKAAGK